MRSGRDYSQGFKESTVRQVVADQIRFAGNFGEKGPTMPKNLVKGQDVDDVAAYVAAVAGPQGRVDHRRADRRRRRGRRRHHDGHDACAAAEAAAAAPTSRPARTPSAPTAAARATRSTAAGTNGKVGPDLDKLKSYAAAREKALEDFIHESIVAPNDYVEKGYPKGVMPDFSHLPKNTLDALVAFLVQSREELAGGANDEPPGQARVASEPVRARREVERPAHLPVNVFPVLRFTPGRRDGSSASSSDP